MRTSERFTFREIPCPVCGENDTKLLGFRGGRAHQNGYGTECSIVRCRRCSHQYPNPMPSPSGTLSDVYNDAEHYFHGHDLERKKLESLSTMAEFETRLGRKGSFLDVGCGIGELLWAARESGWDAVGVDPSEEFIEIGKRELGVEGLATTLEDAGFGDDSFDAVAMSSMIEHVYDPYSLLQEVHRVLRPGGLLCFDAPNEDGLYMKAGNLYMRLLRRDWVVVLAPTFPPYHVQGFNQRSIRTLLNRARFQLLDLSVTGVLWEQQGRKSLRKKIEFAGAKVVHAIGRRLKMGSYMGIWARKPSEDM
jgi:2-polyprenyl-3-methyl-5-hydroxy-6-metoxy-1,4-benzoquinol methylase